jgi:hypothetical protein
MGRLDARWRKYLHNPLWYVATVTVLAALTLRMRAIWWLAGAVALVWGTWLIWQFFSAEGAAPGGADQLKGYLEQAQSYATQIDHMLRVTANRNNTAHRLHLATQINIWAEAIQSLVQHMATLRGDELIRRDLAAVPRAIADLEARLAGEAEPALRAQLERTLAHRRNQLASLEVLQGTLKRAEIQIESTLSLLGTMYSQILIGQSTNQVADYGRLARDVDEEVRRLQDQLEALWEVKGGYRGETGRLLSSLSSTRGAWSVERGERSVESGEGSGNGIQT